MQLYLPGSACALFQLVELLVNTAGLGVADRTPGGETDGGGGGGGGEDEDLEPGEIREPGQGGGGDGRGAADGGEPAVEPSPPGAASAAGRRRAAAEAKAEAEAVVWEPVVIRQIKAAMHAGRTLHVRSGLGWHTCFCSRSNRIMLSHATGPQGIPIRSHKDFFGVRHFKEKKKQPPLSCVSTAFVTKTVLFLAVLR